MNPWCRDAGLTEKGAAQAEAALPEVLALVEKHGAMIVDLALKEARFRHHELPLRTPKFRRRYLAENGSQKEGA